MESYGFFFGVLLLVNRNACKSSLLGAEYLSEKISKIILLDLVTLNNSSFILIWKSP
jgi:hypothetical protein